MLLVIFIFYWKFKPKKFKLVTIVSFNFHNLQNVCPHIKHIIMCLIMLSENLCRQAREKLDTCWSQESINNNSCFIFIIHLLRRHIRSHFSTAHLRIYHIWFAKIWYWIWTSEVSFYEDFVMIQADLTGFPWFAWNLMSLAQSVNAVLKQR